ncbi:GNAT family N-acetyltransferase [Spirosoma radiotolerans]|uniref:GCN5 family acetyltransferase n=1 Tax=Spirosoma radiotolerans TaxID=1379870 RepID=A0A0E3ZV11_9BACT|nr:GNAT family N-acetyltransferase [Spirosoma radiotolerans]AKD55535.1 GCN5 family acetyltransferase [Spirosoma radiotolerans]
MTLLPILADHPYLTPIRTWYETSFPADERRSFQALCQLLPCAAMHLRGLVVQGQLIGFILYWHWPDMLFVEHFAIDPAQRGKQYGQQALSQLLLLESKSPYVLLEVELPQDTNSRRRIQFYERQGFSVNPFSYAQPPYQAGNPSIPMHLMSIPAISDHDTFDSLSKLIKERVYERFY